MYTKEYIELIEKFNREYDMVELSEFKEFSETYQTLFGQYTHINASNNGYFHRAAVWLGDITTYCVDNNVHFRGPMVNYIHWLNGEFRNAFRNGTIQGVNKRQTIR